MKGISVGEFYREMKDTLGLRLVAGVRGINRRVRVAELSRPGLALSGYFEYFAWRRVQVLGKVEITYIRSLSPKARREKLRKLLGSKIPCIIVARSYVIPPELLEEANRLQVPVFRSPLITMRIVNKATLFLEGKFAPSTMMSGNLLEVFGIGVVIRGKSGVGKSECALGLIKNGHRLIADDIIRIRLVEGAHLMGWGDKLTRHHMEIRGLGIINVQTLFGAGCIREDKWLDLVISLEPWDSNKEYERLGIEEKTFKILEITLPHLIIPVRPGRDLTLLVETAALNQRLKLMGYHGAVEFNQQLLSQIKKEKRRL